MVAPNLQSACLPSKGRGVVLETITVSSMLLPPNDRVTSFDRGSVNGIPATPTVTTLLWLKGKPREGGTEVRVAPVSTKARKWVSPILNVTIGCVSESWESDMTAPCIATPPGHPYSMGNGWLRTKEGPSLSLTFLAWEDSPGKVLLHSLAQCPFFPHLRHVSLDLSLL